MGRMTGSSIDLARRLKATVRPARGRLALVRTRAPGIPAADAALAQLHERR